MAILSSLLLLLLLLSAAHGAAAPAPDGYTRSDFPRGFVFGAATSAYQVPIRIDRFPPSA